MIRILFKRMKNKINNDLTNKNCFVEQFKFSPFISVSTLIALNVNGTHKYAFSPLAICIQLAEVAPHFLFSSGPFTQCAFILAILCLMLPLIARKRKDRNPKSIAQITMSEGLEE